MVVAACNPAPGGRELSSPATCMHEPLSHKLAQIVESNKGAEGVSINQLLEQTGGRGFYLVIILLALPFIVPVSLPGVSTLLGLSIALLSLRLALGRKARLPKFMGDRKLSPEAQRRVLTGSVKFLRFLERLVKPRRTPWMTTRPARFVNALLMAFMGLLLALPFPPLPPLTNSLPCYTIILLAASMMEEDGVTIWIAYAVALGTVFYLGFIAGAIQKAFVKAFELIHHWLHP